MSDIIYEGINRDINRDISEDIFIRAKKKYESENKYRLKG